MEGELCGPSIYTGYFRGIRHPQVIQLPDIWMYFQLISQLVILQNSLQEQHQYQLGLYFEKVLAELLDHPVNLGIAINQKNLLLFTSKKSLN